MGHRNLAPGFTPAQSQPVEQQKAICQQKKPLCPIQCHLTISAAFCSSLEPLFQSREGDAPFLAGCPSPEKQEGWHMNIVNKCKKTDFHSGHFVLNCQGWKYESYIEGLKTNRKK